MSNKAEPSSTREVEGPSATAIRLVTVRSGSVYKSDPRILQVSLNQYASFIPSSC